MSENNRNLNKEYSSPEGDSEISSVAAQLQKIQTHLGFLEKKLDLLLAQQPQGNRGGGFGGPRPSGGGGRDFRPRRPFRGGNDFRSREDRPMREGRPPMREGREGRGGDDRPREFRGGHGGGGFKKRPRHF